jgi:hypothetical protein
VRSPAPFLVLTVWATIAGSPNARADTGAAERCASASERAQLRRLQGRLVEARDELIVCSQASCPTLVRRDCDRWLGEVTDALPSIVIAARDDRGGDLDAVHISIDGQPVADRLDGKAIFVDPGSHRLLATSDGKGSVERTVIVREGEKRRAVDIVFGPAPAPATSREVRKDILGWSLVGAGGLAATLGTYFAIRQANDYADAKHDCAPTCTADRRDDILLLRVYSGIAFAVAAAAIGTGVWVLLDRPATRTAWIGPSGIVF